METNVDQPDMTRTLSKQKFIERLDKAFQDKIVNIEFFCGDCCKKAIGGKLTLIGEDFIEITAVTPFTPFLIITFFKAKCIPLVEVATAAIIPLKQVCSVERP